MAETEKGTYIDFEQRPATPIVPEEWIIRNRKSGDVLGIADVASVRGRPERSGT